MLPFTCKRACSQSPGPNENRSVSSLSPRGVFSFWLSLKSPMYLSAETAAFNAWRARNLSTSMRLSHSSARTMTSLRCAATRGVTDAAAAAAAASAAAASAAAPCKCRHTSQHAHPSHPLHVWISQPCSTGVVMQRVVQKETNSHLHSTSCCIQHSCIQPQAEGASLRMCVCVCASV